MTGRHEPWLAQCRMCGLWRSALGSGDGRLQDSTALDEERRQRGLAAVRAANIRLTLDLVGRDRPLQGLRLLDVGCAYGWFLLEARRSGLAGVGIEPDPDIAEAARREGLDVRTGYFPDAVGPAETFDIVSFNDVLEHLADLGGILESCRSILAPGGLLVVVAPSSEGVLYRTAMVLARLGVRAPLGRLWQEGFPSPHLSYFSPGSLDRLVARHGFHPHGRRRLRTFSCRGLKDRIGFDSRHRVQPLVTAALLMAAAPAVNFLLPADQLLSVYRRGD
jgi:SAM-dependent methyltransferase